MEREFTLIRMKGDYAQCSIICPTTLLYVILFVTKMGQGKNRLYKKEVPVDGNVKNCNTYHLVP